MNFPGPKVARRLSLALLLVVAVAALNGCASTKGNYTVDDGGPVDQQMLAGIRTYATAQRLLRHAVFRSSALKDPNCSTQWDLPFSVASSYGLSKESKRAWLRAVSADERLTIIAVEQAASLGLRQGDKIEKIGNYESPNTRRMFNELLKSRDRGAPFKITFSDGKSVVVEPLKVCRGYMDVALPDNPDAQNYHWVHSTHPLSLFAESLTQDEALWAILWTQGLSEEAGVRMKLYDYGVATAKFGIDAALLLTQVQAMSGAANAAAGAVASNAGNAASRAASEAAAQQAAKSFGGREIASFLVKDAFQSQIRATGKDLIIQTVKAATAYRKAFTGVSYIASTGFYMADQWAFVRMLQLRADPLAVFTLHYKLASKGDYRNAFVLDEDRLQNLSILAKDNKLDKQMDAILGETGIAAIRSTQAPNEIQTTIHPAADHSPLPASIAR